MAGGPPIKIMEFVTSLQKTLNIVNTLEMPRVTFSPREKVWAKA
jgi:hypothetical protein